MRALARHPSGAPASATLGRCSDAHAIHAVHARPTDHCISPRVILSFWTLDTSPSEAVDLDQTAVGRRQVDARRGG